MTDERKNFNFKFNLYRYTTVNRMYNWFHEGSTLGDRYPLYVLMAVGMSTQGISNMAGLHKFRIQVKFS